MSYKKALFLDRDGIINVAPPPDSYVTNLDEYVLQREILEPLRMIQNRGFLLFVVTNQRCVARKLITEQQLSLMHEKMLEKLQEEGVAIAKIYVCPHDEGACECRKPLPGLILKARDDFDIKLNESYLLGDSMSDIKAANNAGISKAVLYSSEASEARGVVRSSLRSHLRFALAQRRTFGAWPYKTISNFKELTNIVI